MDFKMEVAGTVMERVFGIMEAGVFADPPIEKVGKSDTEIGMLTCFEKAILTVMSNIADENNVRVIEAENKNQPVDMDKVSKSKREHEALENLFWCSIKGRLEAANEKNATISICAGYKIVSCHEISSDGFSGLDLFRSLGMASIVRGLFGGGDLQVHDCDKCHRYDDCDSPEKKPKKQ